MAKLKSANSKFFRFLLLLIILPLIGFLQVGKWIHKLGNGGKSDEGKLSGIIPSAKADAPGGGGGENCDDSNEQGGGDSCGK